MILDNKIVKDIDYLSILKKNPRFIDNSLSNEKTLGLVCDKIDDYIESDESSKSKLNLLISVYDYMKDKKGVGYRSYSDMVDYVYYELKEKVSINKLFYKDDTKMLDFIGEGFVFVMDEYSNYPDILEFTAKRMINDIFSKIDLESLIHDDFGNLELFRRCKINSYLISVIAEYDSFLAQYVSCHIDLLNIIKERLLCIENNWSNYFEQQEAVRINKFLDDLDSYFKDNPHLDEKVILKKLSSDFSSISRYVESDTDTMDMSLTDNYGYLFARNMYLSSIGDKTSTSRNRKIQIDEE